MDSPAFQFYPKEFLSDENVQLMSNEERGIYITLLSHCWIEGSIPADDEMLKRLCHCASEPLKAVKKCFKILKKNDSRMVHPRLEKEKKKQYEYKKSKIEAGKKGAKKRWESGKPEDSTAIGLPLAKNAFSSASSSAIAIPTAEASMLAAPKIQKKIEDSDENFSNQGFSYAIGSENPNFTNLGWIKGYLIKQFKEIRDSRPDIPPEAVLQVWQECCDDASSKAVSSPKWYRSAFENRITEWRAGKTQRASPKSAHTRLNGRDIVSSQDRKGGEGKL